MHRRDVYFYLGLLSFAASVTCWALGYFLASAIIGVIAFSTSSFSVKNGKGNLGIWECAIVSIGFGYTISPQNYAMPVAMLLLGLMPALRLIFFKSLGYTGRMYMEVGSYVTGLALFIGSGVYYHFNWIQWTFPGICFLFGLLLTAIFTMGSLDVKRRVSNFLGIRTGGKAPDFNLQDQDGNNTTLSEYKGKRHVLLIFVRGDWCPTCHIMLRTYERNKNKFAEKNIQLLAIGPDPVGVNKAMMERLDLDYKVLSDDKGEAAKAFGMLFQSNNPDTKFQEGIPLPAAFLIDVNGVIAYTSNPKKPGEMLMPETIFPVVEKLKAA